MTGTLGVVAVSAGAGLAISTAFAASLQTIILIVLFSRRHDRDSINGIKPRIASGELLEDAKMAAIAAIVVICYNAEEVQTHIARRTV